MNSTQTKPKSIEQTSDSQDSKQLFNKKSSLSEGKTNPATDLHLNGALSKTSRCDKANFQTMSYAQNTKIHNLISCIPQDTRNNVLTKRIRTLNQIIKQNEAEKADSGSMLAYSLTSRNNACEGG